MKLLAAELVSLQSGSLVSSFLASTDGLDTEALRRRFVDLESGSYFTALGVSNFLEGDFFSWYLDNADVTFWQDMRALCRELSYFEPATGVLDPATTRDLLKELYEALIPRSLRHHLGEYYTPDWLADLTLERSGFTGNPGERLLDPACGSGTFLALAIRRIREAGDKAYRSRRDVAQSIIHDLAGFDINPLAVIAARTNFLLALGPLLRFVTPLALPIYLCDSVLSPLRSSGAQLALGRSGVLASATDATETLPISTSAGTIEIPRDLVADSLLVEALSIIEQNLKMRASRDVFSRNVGRALGYADHSRVVALTADLYEQLARLSDEGDFQFWPRYLKNSLAPVTLGRFGFVVGNPPWIGWEELSPEYRMATAAMWSVYGLFSLKGHAAHLGGGKKDLSMLMLYAAADNYLELGGKIAFVITQSVLKSRKAGDGFRRFRIGNGEPLRVITADDFSSMNPFEASNSTAILTVTKGEETVYPVRYQYWTAPRGVRPNNSWALRRVENTLTSRRFEAAPLSKYNRSSPWFTVPLGLESIRDVMAPAHYKAIAGVSTWLNSVFFVIPESRFADGSVVISNIHEAGDILVPAVTAAVEAGLLFPTCRMRDVQRWKGEPSCWSIIPQDPLTKRGYTFEIMQERYPLTLQYLIRFEGYLRRRSGFKKYHEHAHAPWYSIYNVDPSTFLPFHVMWQQMKPRIDACVVSSARWDEIEKPVVTQHVVSTIGFRDGDEAHYVASWLNSSLSTVISKYSSTGKSFGTPSFLDTLPIPRYNCSDARHLELTDLSRRAHSNEGGRSVQPRIDSIIADIVGLSERTSAQMIRDADLTTQEPNQMSLAEF